MDLVQIQNQISGAMSSRIVLCELLDADFKVHVPDATRKFGVHAESGFKGVLLISGTGNPSLVARAVENIRLARNRLSNKTASHILQPVLSSQEAGVSFAVWPMMRATLSGNRVKRYVARHPNIGAVLDWSVAVCIETAEDGDAAKYLADLNGLETDTHFPAQMRQAANDAMERLQAGVWAPKQCLHHEDFWVGNVLVGQRGHGPEFHVIDWAGMNLQGYPFLDLARMLESARVGGRTRRAYVEKLRAALGSAPCDTLAYCLSGVGNIGQNLEFFPQDRYRAMAIKVYETMKNT